MNYNIWFCRCSEKVTNWVKALYEETKGLILDHDIKIYNKVMECVQEYIYLRQKILYVHIMKKKSNELGWDGVT